jgi:transposase
VWTRPSNRLRNWCSEGQSQRKCGGIRRATRRIKLENKVSLGFVEGLKNKIRVIRRRAYGLRNEEYLRLKVLTCMLPAL